MRQILLALVMVLASVGVAAADSVVGSLEPSAYTITGPGNVTFQVHVNVADHAHALGGYGAGSTSGGIYWDTGVFDYVSHAGGQSPFNSPTVNTAYVDDGRILFADADQYGASGDVVVFEVTLKKVGCGDTTVDLVFSSMFCAGYFENLMPYLSTLGSEVSCGL